MIDFVRITQLAVDAELRAQTAQVVGYGDETDGGDAEQADEVEVTHPLGFISRPVVTDTLEGVVVMRGDEPVVLALVDKGAAAQAVEEGEARMHGVGSGNAAAVTRIRNSGAIELTPKSGQDLVLAGGTKKVARVDDPVSAVASLATWISSVTTFVNGIAPGTLTPPTGFGTIASSGGAPNVKA